MPEPDFDYADPYVNWHLVICTNIIDDELLVNFGTKFQH